MSVETLALATQLGAALLQRQWRVGTAESCTGGLVAAAITDVAGSSSWFDEGVVTYANSSKMRLLGVGEQVLAACGAVSREVVEAMAHGVLASGADMALATSGVAGPAGGTVDKPVGTVWFAWGGPNAIQSEVCLFHGDRLSIRCQSVAYILRRAVEFAEKAV